VRVLISFCGENTTINFKKYKIFKMKIETIKKSTAEIQQLVITRTISDLRIEQYIGLLRRCFLNRCAP
jgi:hypothetical protein